MTRGSFAPRWIGLLATCVIAACGPMMTTDGGGTDGSRDTGGGDTRVDTGPVDTGTVDTGTVDTGTDTGPVDTGTDTGPVDTGTPDTGDDVQVVDVIDTGAVDAGDDTMIGTDVVDVPTPIDVPMVDVVDVVPPTDVPVAPTCPFTVNGALALPSTTSGMLMGSNDLTTTGCQPTVGGPDDIYSLHLDTMTGVSLRTTGSLDTVVTIRTACDMDTSEVGCDDDHGPGTLSSLRRVLPAGDYFVTVDQYGTAPTGGAYGLEAVSFTPVPNENCMTPSVLVPGTAQTGDSNAGLDTPSQCLTGSDGPQLYYSLTVPAASRATITSTPGSTFRAALRVFNSCTATTCVVSTTSTAAGTAATVTVDNRDPAMAVTYLIGVGSTTTDTNGTFSINSTVAPLPSSANAMCSMATMIGDGTMLTGQDITTGMDQLTGACLTTAAGRVLYYTATVPANSAITVTATPSTGWNPVIRALDMCGAATCLASANSAGTSAAETYQFSNTGTTPRTIILAVGATSATATGTFDLRATISSNTAANSMCSMATALTPGTAVTAQNSAAGVDMLSTACADGGAGTALYYTVSIPSNSTLSARVTPSGFDPVVQLLDACGSTTCLGSADAGGVNGPETLTFHNGGATARTVVVSVGSFSATVNGLFDITATITPDPYVVTPIATAMCDDMTSAMVLAGVNSDDSASAVTALPSAFTYFGTSEAFYSVTSNGFLQLWPDATGTPSTEYNNAVIPTAGVPNSIVAPFWDDLTVPTGETSDVRVLNVTTAPAHFTVQWTNWTTFGATSTRLTFQVQLYAGTNVIEYRYCNLVPGTAATRSQGDSATVGVENSTGTVGMQYSNNTASLTTGTGLRFTPVP